MSDRVCPFCGSGIVAIVEVIYERKIDKVTGEIVGRGKKLGEQIVNIKCSKCDGYHNHIVGGWVHLNDERRWNKSSSS